jgi:DNA-binding MarR family transcriptional regulator
MQKNKAHMQYMSRAIGDILTEYRKLSERETKILETIIEMENGNVYNIWKASGLKHYPTVLRVVKKLEQKKMVEMLSGNGERGEKIYSPTLLGSLTHFSLKEDAAKLVEIVSRKSQSFDDMVKANVLDDPLIWVASLARGIMYDLRDRSELSIDDILEMSLDQSISDALFEIETRDHKSKLIRFAKLDWLRDIILETMDGQIRDDTEHIKKLQAFKKTLAFG